MATGEVMSLQQFNDQKKRIQFFDLDGEPVVNTPARFVIKEKPGLPEDETVMVVAATTDALGWAEFVFAAEDMTFYGVHYYRVDTLPDGEIHTHLTGRLDVLAR